jgi:hypothetical protein
MTSESLSLQRNGFPKSSLRSEFSITDEKKLIDKTIDKCYFEKNQRNLSIRV